LPCFPICVVSHGAGVDDVTVRLFIKRHERVSFPQPALNHRGIILVDLAAQSGNGYAHGFASQNISDLKNQMSDFGHLKFRCLQFAI
jgi:hypothetical protein